MLDHLAPLPDTPTCALVTNAWACPRTRLLADGYCILHSPDPRKNLKKFSLRIAMQIGDKDFNFEHVVFPAGYQLPAGEYVSADFSHAVFQGDTEFEGCHFEDGAYFNDTVFNGRLSLRGTAFDGRASFLATRFIGVLDARGVIFAGDVDFSGSKFERLCRFDGVDFQEQAAFSKAMFCGPAAFGKATFEGEVEFIDTVLESSTSLAGSWFSGYADFSGLKFDSETENHDWIACTFRSKVLFGTNAVIRNLNLSQSTFKSDVTFSSVILHGPIEANECTFMSNLSFGQSTLLGSIELITSQFQGQISFVNIVSPVVKSGLSSIHIYAATMDSEFAVLESELGSLYAINCNLKSVSIIGSAISGYVSLEETTISERLRTDNARLAGRVDLTRTALPARHVLQGVLFDDMVDFAGVNLDGITFRQMDLANCRFANSINLAKAEFDNVTWASWPARGSSLSFALVELLKQSAVTRWDSWAERQRHRQEWSRVAVADELDARRSGIDPEERRQKLRAAERVYRALRASHETHKDHPRACDFYYAEMEMRRLAGSLNPLSPHRDYLTPLYALVSGYGEDWRRAALWFLALWLMWAFFYLGFGLSVKSTVPTSDGVQQLRLVEVGGPNWWAACWNLACPLEPVGNALMHSFYVATFVGRDTYAVVRPGWGEVVQLVELVFGPVFLGFGALAIRRRFQR